MSDVYRREVVTLPLADTVKEKLLIRGYRTMADLEHRTLRELIDEDGLTTLEAVDVLRVTTSSQIEPRSAAHLLSIQQQKMQRISTSCADLDTLMQGGVQTGRLTELCTTTPILHSRFVSSVMRLGGGPGIGKTQIGMQLCVNVHLPVEQEGLDADSIVIDTEGSFSIDRLFEIAQGTLDVHCPTSRKRPQGSVSRMTPESILAGVHYFRVHNHIQQLAVFETLPDLLQKHPRVRLIIVDSISFHFRQGFVDMGHRMRVLNRVAQDLMALAESTHTAIVFTNQVTKHFYENNESETVPVLGNSWGQCTNTQVRLYWNASTRYAGIYKAPDMERRAVPFQITKDGIRNLS